MEVSPVPVKGRDPRSVDAYAPREVAQRVRTAGIEDTGRSLVTTLWLALIGGAMLGLGAAGATAAMAGSTSGFGTTRFVGGIVFGLGLTLVMVGGGELFTSNNLIAMAWVSRQVTIGRLALNWVIVFVGNLVSVVSVAVLLWIGGAYRAGDDAFAAEALRIAASKSGRLFHQDVALGILGNALVCLAVWLCFSARTTTDRILSCLLPMTALIVLGVDHVVANLHYLAAGLLLRGDAATVEAAGLDAAALADLSLAGIVGNIVGVTIGNIIGGSVLVAAVYWFVYLRAAEDHGEEAEDTVATG